MPKGYDEQMYWVDEWMPQIEVLAHPAVKAGITHCGPGGAFEFIHCGVVPLCFPHYATEQKYVADALIERGAGLALIDTKLADRQPEPENLYFPLPIFSSADVAKKFGELLSVPAYSDNLMALKCVATAAGGR